MRHSLVNFCNCYGFFFIYAICFFTPQFSYLCVLVLLSVLPNYVFVFRFIARFGETFQLSASRGIVVFDICIRALRGLHCHSTCTPSRRPVLGFASLAADSMIDRCVCERCSLVPIPLAWSTLNDIGCKSLEDKPESVSAVDRPGFDNCPRGTLAVGHVVLSSGNKLGIPR